MARTPLVQSIRYSAPLDGHHRSFFSSSTASSCFALIKETPQDLTMVSNGAFTLHRLLYRFCQRFNIVLTCSPRPRRIPSVSLPLSLT